jgi:hypothetical protein
MLINRLSAVSAVCALAAVIGGLGPWVSVVTAFGSATVDGSQGDGNIVAVIGVTAAVLLGLRSFMVSKALGMAGFFCHVINAGFGAYKWADFYQSIAGSSNDFGFVKIGWGIPLIVFASIAGMACEFASLNGVGSTDSIDEDNGDHEEVYFDDEDDQFDEDHTRGDYDDPEYSASLSVYPDSAPAGTELVVRSEGFFFDDEPVFSWSDGGGREHQSRSKPTSTDQGFIGRFAVPSWETPGIRRIKISTPDGRFAVTNFTVTESVPADSERSADPVALGEIG